MPESVRTTVKMPTRTDKVFSIKLQNAFVAIIPIMMVGADCGSREKKSRYDSVDGGYILRDECNAPTDTCFEDCFRREASITCAGCCREQRFLCDTQQKHSYDHCKSAQ